MLIDGPRANLRAIPGDNTAMILSYRVMSSDAEQVSIGIGAGILDLTDDMAARVGDGWQLSRIPLHCFAQAGADLESVTEPLVLEARGELKLQVKSVHFGEGPASESCGL